MTEEKIVKDNLVVAIEYTLTVDDEVIDSSEGRQPLEFLQGQGNIISGLEREMLGMKNGESKEVVVLPIDGYGEIDEEAFIEAPKNQFPENIPVEVGTELQVENENGDPAYVRIEQIENNMVLLNFNHPLAGKELHFEVQILEVKDAD